MVLFSGFSAGYYVGQLYIEPYSGNHAVMDRDQHEAANEQVYATGDGLNRLDYPLVVKIGDHHLPVLAADDIPTDTLGLPEAVLDMAEIDTPPTVMEILVAKADRAAQLLEWATPYTFHPSAVA